VAKRKKRKRARRKPKAASTAKPAAASSGKKATGFALLTPEERAARGSRGGKRAHALGKAHTFAPGKEARRAGRRGGYAKGSKEKDDDAGE
jgi:hypothetical protein